MSQKDTRGSHSVPAACLLTLAGGMLDAYTYIERGGVFANAQTGNTVKLGIYLAQGRHEEILSLLIPIASFILGTVAAAVLRRYMKRRNIRFLYRGTIVLEILTILTAAFLPHSSVGDRIANCLISFACAIQTETFKRFSGQVVATTVSTGNLRKTVEFAFDALYDRDMESFRNSLLFFLFVFLFIGGAWLQTYLVGVSAYSVLFTLFPLSLCILLITRRMKTSSSVHKPQATDTGRQ